MALAYRNAGPEGSAPAEAQFDAADNMTDAQAAMTCLADVPCAARERVLQAFYDRWRDRPLVLDKWFAVQASATLPGTPEVVRQLTTHSDFTYDNPNRVRSLLGVFSQNPSQFHDGAGDGYRLLADAVLEVDRQNPQLASRLVSGFNSWKRYDAARRERAKEQLTRISAREGLSKDVGEIVGRSLS